MKRSEYARLLTGEQRLEFGRDYAKAIENVNQNYEINTKRQYRSLINKALKALDKKYEAIALAN